MLTRSPNLAEKLRTYSARLLSTLSQKTTVPFNADRQASWSLFDLESAKFPLVCTYEQFLMLVRSGVEKLHPAASQTAMKRHPDLNIVDFKAFKSRFWPHFPQHLTKGLSPDLVFSDIMGVIKGSVYTCKNLSFLSLSQYEDLSVRVTPNVTNGEDRRRVFRMYEIYEELKRKTSHLDTIDYVLDLLRLLRMDPNLVTLLASCIQEIYVDEVQDQRCLDISLLLTLVHNPLGVHFGGDTAQAISQDSVFRFQDVKALFHDHFFLQSVSVDQQHLAQPHIFTLSRNYRSHQGILSVASSVMGLLWKTFPDTVDKLEPEVGTMIGPAPILFHDCYSSILMHHSNDASTAPQHELLFGAEQVVIARDDISKADLAKQVGETVLILTILQAKGMEFDDVILWNFFTTTPDAVGWRSLCDFMDGKLSFYDTAKHAVLCSELKNLYVAITRARVRVLFVENSGDAAHLFVKLVNKDSALALIEVTSPGSSDFEEKVKSLQPRKSDDPHRWLAIGAEMMTRFLYREAAICFRRGQNPVKAKEAEAYEQKERAEKLNTMGDILGSRDKFLAAAAAFQELGFISEASDLLIRGNRPGDAAELWYTNKSFEQAAVLFESVSNYRRAFESWDAGRIHNKAIIALHQGQLFDEMIKYLVEHQSSLDSREESQHKRAVKLLLKKQRISADSQALAITLIGTYAEQESYFQQYGMIQNLVDLYRREGKPTKLFKVLLELGELEEASKVVQSLDPDTRGYPDKSFLDHLEALVWVDRIILHSERTFKISSPSEDTDTWQYAFKVLGNKWDPLVLQEQILGMNDHSVTKAFLCLYVTVCLCITLSNSSAHREVSSGDKTHRRPVQSHIPGPNSVQFPRHRLIVTKFDRIPFDILSHAIKLISVQPINPQSIVGQAVLLLSGVFQSLDAQRKYTIRAWSPLNTVDQPMQFEPSQLAEAAMRLTVDLVTGAILPVHETMKELFRAKWPTPCSFYLVNGSCGDRSHKVLNRHEYVSPHTYAAKLDDLLKVNKSVCQITPLYYRRAMSGGLLAKFLGARRSWLEKLLGELSFVSGLEQDSLVLMTVAERFRTDESLAAVALSIEENLFYKAREEWKSQAYLGYVLEQLDCVAHLKSQVKQRLVWRTRAQLRYNHPSTHQSLLLAEALQAHVRSGDPVQYYQALQIYLQMLRTLKFQDFAAFHCHTSMFEAISLYLLLQMSQDSIMVPRSWSDLHIADILGRNDLSSRPVWSQRCTFRDALILLLREFVALLKWLNDSLPADGRFYVCGTWYHSRILQQRNVELLAIILVNLVQISSLRPQSLVHHWGDVVKVFQLPTMKAWHLDHGIGNYTELQTKLLGSRTRYWNKNPLIIINVVDSHSHSFDKLQQLHKLKSESLTNLRKRYISTIPSENSANPGAGQGAKEEQAVACIQRHWRHHGPGIIARHKARDAFASTEIGRAVTKLQSIGKATALKIRCSLLHYGVDCLVQLNSLTEKVAGMRKRAFDYLDSDTVEQHETLGTVLEAAENLGDAVRAHHERTSDQALASLVTTEGEGGIKELLVDEMVQMSREEVKAEEMFDILKGMS